MEWNVSVKWKEKGGGIESKTVSSLELEVVEVCELDAASLRPVGGVLNHSVLSA